MTVWDVGNVVIKHLYIIGNMPDSLFIMPYPGAVYDRIQDIAEDK